MIINSADYNGKCKCGHSHKVITEKIIIEPKGLSNFSEYIEDADLSGNCAVIYDENTYNAVNMTHISTDNEIILNPENLHADEYSTEVVLSKIKPDTAYLVAVGGGVIHDITRYCANELSIPFVSCPTCASVDGFCSTVAAMTWHGFKKSFSASAPKIVIADIDVIKEAPMYLALSGIGDILGKFTALADWKISNLLTGEAFCEVIENIVRDATNAVYESSNGIMVKDEKSFEKLMYGLLMSGLGMQMAGNSRPASGAEHHISHLIEMEIEKLGVHSDALHGEKVGVAEILLAEEYYKMAENLDNTGAYREMTDEYIKNFFGKHSESVMEENANDDLLKVSVEDIIKNKDKIRSFIKEIPKADELKKLYAEIGLKADLNSIDVPTDKLPQLLEYSPCVRRRVTFLRMRRFFK